MKKIFTVLLLLFSSVTYSQSNNKITNFIARDSLPNVFISGWKFIEGGDSTMALPAYDDSKWKEINSIIQVNGVDTTGFKEVGWFRVHFIADTSITGRPLAMAIAHMGASEIYLDGKRIKSYGTIDGPDSSSYYDPEEIPFVFSIPDSGEHVLAVHYANYDAEKNFKIYRYSRAGFTLTIGETDDMISGKNIRNTIFTFILMLLCGIFFALSLIHMFMYLFFIHVKSNLYFSIFMFSLALACVIAFICSSSHSPDLELKSFYLVNPVFVIACISLAGFIRELFSKGRVRFLIIAAFGILTLVFRIFGVSYFGPMTVALIIAVSFDAVFTVIFAIIRRVKGARIIGTGILCFCLFILTIFTMALIKGGNMNISDSTVGGQILVIFLALAILSIPVSMSVYLAWNFSSVNQNLFTQLDQVKVLSQKNLEQEQEKQRLLESRKEELEEEVTRRTAELSNEKRKSDELLLNILPVEVAEELKQNGRTNAKTYSMVTVMFTDFKDFTDVSEKVSAELLVAEIDYCFSAFDRIIQNYKVEKIKTIGDAYICAGGMPVLNFTHAVDMVNAAIDIRDFMEVRKKEKESKGEIPFVIRIGIHTGPVVAGIVGVKKFAYDIWGDTVNLANRMESSGEVGKINISGATYELIKNAFQCVHRGKITAKNKGEIDMYFAERRMNEG